VPRRFVEGYRRVRPREVAGHERHLTAGPDEDWPEWATRLRVRIDERAAALRESLATG